MTAPHAQQIAEEILDGTGWALNWQLPADPAWLIPAGGYLATGTPLERLLALIAPLKGSLYSDPAGYQCTAYPRYPVLPWQWETAAVDVALPEAALLSWNQAVRISRRSTGSMCRARLPACCCN